MKDFNIVVMPGKIQYGTLKCNFHAQIRYKNGKLSISGVVGAMRGGNCNGGCGQCQSTLIDPEFKPAENWTSDMVKRFYDYWERWHLNDMRPECEHQRADGWREKAVQKVTLYHWTLTREALSEQKAAEKAALEALQNGETFTPTSHQQFIASQPYSLITITDTIPDDKIAPLYEPEKFLCYKGHTRTKTLGWLTEKQHPDGILNRPCPVCGYKYGAKWLHEDVPEDVLEWLFTCRKLSKSVLGVYDDAILMEVQK